MEQYKFWTQLSEVEKSFIKGKMHDLQIQVSRSGLRLSQHILERVVFDSRRFNPIQCVTSIMNPRIIEVQVSENDLRALLEDHHSKSGKYTYTCVSLNTFFIVTSYITDKQKKLDEYRHDKNVKII